MARDKGHLTDLQLRHWIKAGQGCCAGSGTAAPRLGRRTTGKGPRKAVDGGHAPGRLLQAREFHESARSLVGLAQSKSYNPAVPLMVTAAIAHRDAITASARGIVNQQDHPGAPRLF